MLFDGYKYIPFILKVFHFVQIFFKYIRILPQNTSFKQVNIAMATTWQCCATWQAATTTKSRHTM